MTGALPVVLVGSPAERLASLFDVHHDRLYRLARRLASSTDDALDLVQDSFLKAARFPKSIPIGAVNEEAWLVRVLINIRRDQWRKASLRNHHGKAAFGSSYFAIGGRDPETALIAKATDEIPQQFNADNSLARRITVRLVYGVQPAGGEWRQRSGSGRSDKACARATSGQYGKGSHLLSHLRLQARGRLEYSPARLGA